MAETVLLSTLDAYGKQLESQLATLRARHQELETAWGRLRDVYEGEGAQLFGEAFQAASKELGEYGTQGAVIERQLRSKVEELRAFESAGSDL
jgi:uncharacterized protein YukE